MKKLVPNKRPIHVKVGDKVKVLTGDDKGKIGIIKNVFLKKNMIVVEDINIKIKNFKSNRTNENGQIKEFAFPIHSSNVELYKEE